MTPHSALELAWIYKVAGLPAGVFNVVQGAEATGQALVRHRDIAKVSVTGEVGTGKAIMADAAPTLKRVTMELGGKSPLLVFSNADLENAVRAAMMGNFFTQGEVCSNGTRVFVEARIMEAFVERLLPRVEGMRIGDPMQPETQVGPLISKPHLMRVLSYIERGVSEGARLRCGGGRPREFPRGYYLQPTVFDRCKDEMTVVREEIFGPVMSILSFESEEEVVARPNATEMGLAAGVFTSELARAHRVAAALRAGTCWINNYNITPLEMPFGGMKQSGMGRENGLAAVQHYTEMKSVYVEMGDVDCPY